MGTLPWSALSLSTQPWIQAFAVPGITASKGLINHRGIKWTTRLKDFSGYLIMLVASLLYLSYIVPVALGFWIYDRTWRINGPWTLGRMFKPLCLIAVAGSFGLIWVGIQPPNDKALDILGWMAALMGILWFGIEKKRFKGPPIVSLKDVANSESIRSFTYDPDKCVHALSKRLDGL